MKNRTGGVFPVAGYTWRSVALKGTKDTCDFLFMTTRLKEVWFRRGKM